MSQDRPTNNERAICAVVEHKWTSPTDIPKLIWPGTRRHSAWASPICLRMVKKGYLERNERGWYKTTALGERVLHD